MNKLRIANTLIFFFWLVTFPMVAFLGVAGLDPGIESGVDVPVSALFLFLGIGVSMGLALFRWDQWLLLIPGLFLASALIATSLIITYPAVAALVPGFPLMLFGVGIDTTNHVPLFSSVFALLFVIIPAGTTIALRRI